MAKEAAKKTREELIAEANAKNKSTSTETPKEYEKLPENPTVDQDPETINPPDPPLSGEAAKAAKVVFEDSEDAEEDARFAEKKQQAEEAVKLLRNILAGAAPTAPNEHVLFGNGGGRFTLGHLRALFAGE